jgi:hypothetical protein
LGASRCLIHSIGLDFDFLRVVSIFQEFLLKFVQFRLQCFDS